MNRRLSTQGASNFMSSLKLPNNFNFPKIPFNTKWFLRIVISLAAIFVVVAIVGYFIVIRPLLAIAADAKDLKQSTSVIQQGLAEQDLGKVKDGLDVSRKELQEFRTSFENDSAMLRKLPKTEPYYQDGQRLISVAEESIGLGELVVEIIEPHAADIGFSINGVSGQDLPAQERVVKLINLMPQFSPKVAEISERMATIDSELAQIDASRYPVRLPGFMKRFGVDPELNVREQILTAQAISGELADKAPQFESLFNAIPEFMGLNEPKKYMILMANNYELRMAGGFNTYVIIAEFDQGIPQITYQIDTYFIDEGDRTGSSSLVNRNVPYFLSNYLYIQNRNARLYARDATSTSADFPTAADALLDGFWYKDRSLPQGINGVISINNDLAVDILRVVGPVNTEKYSIQTDSGGYITIPVTEFNADNVIEELESIAGGKLAETIGRKDIIKFLGQSILEKIFTSEATNLLSITKVMLDSMSKKDVMLYSFDPSVEQAFDDLGYSGKIEAVPTEWDYLHVNRSNFGAGKADWTKPGFVHQTVNKNLEVVNGKKISTVEVTIHNPKRPDWFNIDPCCFYNAYLRVYAPEGSQLMSVTASDGQDAKGTECLEAIEGKACFESFTRQQKQTDLTVTYQYELPDTVDIDNYNLFIQRQSGSSIDTYNVGLNGDMQEILLNSDKFLTR